MQIGFDLKGKFDGLSRYNVIWAHCWNTNQDMQKLS